MIQNSDELYKSICELKNCPTSSSKWMLQKLQSLSKLEGAIEYIQEQIDQLNIEMKGKEFLVLNASSQEIFPIILQEFQRDKDQIVIKYNKLLKEINKP